MRKLVILFFVLGMGMTVFAKEEVCGKTDQTGDFDLHAVCIQRTSANTTIVFHQGTFESSEYSYIVSNGTLISNGTGKQLPVAPVIKNLSKLLKKASLKDAAIEVTYTLKDRELFETKYNLILNLDSI